VGALLRERREKAMRALWIVGAGACLLTGCAAHVDLTAPAADASLRSRVRAYDQLKSLSYHQTTTVVVGRFGASSSTSTDYMQLANGTRVYYPEDVLPVVPEGSPAAVAAQSSESNRNVATTLLLTGIAAGIAGTVVAVVPFTQPNDSGQVNLTPVFVGLGIVGAAAIVELISGVFRHSSADDAATAYETYDASLLQKLQVCAGDRGIGACE
jgi:hypothetical protein